MTPLASHEFHLSLGACFGEVNGQEVVDHYGDPLAEHAAVQHSAGLFDLSFRSRWCVTGADRQRYLNGQVTNNVKTLAPGQGCYAALVNAKGRLESDLTLHCLADEVLLDFEPGMGPTVSQRLERHIVADDVQLVDVSASYGLLSLLGPRAGDLVRQLNYGADLPQAPLHSVTVQEPGAGDVVIVNHARGTSAGFDLFVPASALPAVAARLLELAPSPGARPGGWQALEILRIEAGLPRFGVDMDSSNLAPEAGLDRAISADKGCYVGQEILNRLRTFAHVNRLLCGLRLETGPARLPERNAPILAGGKEVGHLTSVVNSPTLGCPIALGYIRREASAPGTEVSVRVDAAEIRAVVTALPGRTTEFLRS